MMMRLFLGFILGSLSGVAFAAEFDCSISIVTTAPANEEIRLNVVSDGKLIQAGSLEISLLETKPGAFELQIFEPIKPARYYSRALIRKLGDSIGYSSWEREQMIDVDCSLIKN